MLKSFLNNRVFFFSVSVLVCFAKPSMAGVYSCSMTGRPVELNLFPKSFVVDYSPLRATILQPSAHRMAGLDFKKGLFGSWLYANYAVPQKGKQFIHSQIQLLIDEDTGSIRMKLGTQGYKPIEAKGICKVAGESDLAEPNRVAGEFESGEGSTLNFSRKFKLIQVNPNNDEILQKAYSQRSVLTSIILESGRCSKGKDSQPWDDIVVPARYDDDQIVLSLSELQASRFAVFSRESRFCVGIKAEKGGWAKRTYRRSQ
jgi:hypothetical protein